MFVFYILILCNFNIRRNKTLITTTVQVFFSFLFDWMECDYKPSSICTSSSLFQPFIFPFLMEIKEIFDRTQCRIYIYKCYSHYHFGRPLDLNIQSNRRATPQYKLHIY